MYRHATIAILIAVGAVTHPASAEIYSLSSPNQRLRVVVNVDEEVSYQVEFGGQVIVKPSVVALTLDGKSNWHSPKAALEATEEEIRDELHPVVPAKRAVIEDRCRQLTLQLSEEVALQFRAYDEAVAYRWTTTLPGRVTVDEEKATFNFAEDADVWFPREKDLFTGQEQLYERVKLSELGEADFAATPVLVAMPGGVKVLVAESNLRDYPGMYVRGDSSEATALVSKFAAYPLKTSDRNDRHSPVTKYADYLAKTSGKRTYPWRVLLVADDDRQLVASEIVYKLAAPCELADTSWITPGKVPWDWWNALNLRNVPFRAGVNTDTYKHFIDFAAEHGLEYVVLDEGWSDTTDLMKINPEVDIAALVDHGRQRGVKLILWVVWRTLDQQMEQALDAFEEWGIAGIKVDFMNRDDQWMVNFYERVAREAAERKLIVDFHGSYKPTGLRRAYPNVLTREGVKGLESCKWSDQITPEHNVTLPFIRMVAGPMDYTPGAMRNAMGENFRAIFNRPMSQSTRCHQLAMYVVYESPLQMLADSPSNYRNEPECLEFIAKCPTVWDDTVVIAGRVGEYIAVARRHSERWFMGAMTDGNSRELPLELDFLPRGNYRVRAWQDGINADRHAEDYQLTERTVKSSDRLQISMAPGGGWAAILEQTD